MTAPELDRYVRDQMAVLEAQRPGAARTARRAKWDEARAAFTAAVADRTGVDAGFVADLLEQRDLVRQSAAHSFEAWRLAADDMFVTAVMAAAALTAAAAPSRAKARAGSG